MTNAVPDSPACSIEVSKYQHGKPMPRLTSSPALVFASIAGLAVSFGADEWLSGINWLQPPQVTPGTDNGPPSDAIVLFDGQDLSQ